MIVRCSPLFQAHISASLILNGVAVRWVGHIDLERLEGTGRIEFDHQLAKVSELDQIQGKLFQMLTFPSSGRGRTVTTASAILHGAPERY